MMKTTIQALFVGFLALLTTTQGVAQEGAGELGAPQQNTPGAPDAPVTAPDAPVPPGGPVVAQPPVVSADGLVFRGTQMTAAGRIYELGCNAGMHFAQGPVVYVQCAGAVIVVDTANARATTFAVNGMPTNFFEQGGRVWVELNHDTAHPVESLPSLAPPSPQAFGAPPAQPQINAQAPRGPQVGPGLDPELAAVRGQVVKFDSGDVHIRFANGTPQVYAGTRVAFTHDDMDPVVGTLSARAGDLFIARVSYGESVAVGARAELTNAPTTGSSTIPERQSSFRMALTARGLIGAGQDGGGGIIADLDLEWRLKSAVFLRLLVEPFGVGFGDETIGFVGAHAIAGYDSSFLGIGIGLGFQLVEADVGGTFSFDTRLGIGTSLGFLLRIGSPEGFHIELFNAMTYVDRFRFGSLRFRAQWGLGHRNWMVVRGGGGITRAAYGEIGFRRLLGGWSGDGPVFITASFGGSAILSDISGFELYVGPTFGLTIEKIF